jgi:hypothetical protein
MLNKRTQKIQKTLYYQKKTKPMMMIPYIEKLQIALYWKRPYIDTEKNVNIGYFPDSIGNIGPWCNQAATINFPFFLNYKANYAEESLLFRKRRLDCYSCCCCLSFSGVLLN